jgi:hypothetical protein
VTDLLRALLRTATIFLVGMTGWLVSVVVAVLPVRDPGSIGLWSAVAAGSGGLALVALLATMRRDRLGPGLGGALAILSAAAIAFGAVALASSAIPRDSGHGEGYLLLIGAILGVEGGLGLAWLATVVTAHRRRPA